MTSLFLQMMFPPTADDPRYAWIITHDYLEIPGTSSAVGTAGPRTATPDELSLARRKGRAFALYDDDGTLYFRGRLWTQSEPGSETDFGPLSDFGQPYAGCTEIRFNGVPL